MGAYRYSRNLEATIVDYITAELDADDWTGITVLKGFPESYKGMTPFIGVEALDRPITSKEIGSTTIWLDIVVTIRIFAENDGQRLDLSDWLVDDKMRSNINYYDYVIEDGEVSTKTLAGKIRFLSIPEDRKELVNTEGLIAEDRYRHIIRVVCRISLS
jgi:hypothetical protein